MSSQVYADAYNKYLDLARTVAHDLSKKYGRRDELVAEAASALGHVIMRLWGRIQQEARNEASCVAQQVQWELLSYIRSLCKRIHEPLKPTIPHKAKAHSIDDVPEKLKPVVALILANPERFKCRPNVLKYTSTPVCKFLMASGVPESEAVEIQMGLEEYYKEPVLS